jgi:hypothetical protein
VVEGSAGLPTGTRGKRRLQTHLAPQRKPGPRDVIFLNHEKDSSATCYTWEVAREKRRERTGAANGDKRANDKKG